MSSSIVTADLTDLPRDLALAVVRARGEAECWRRIRRRVYEALERWGRPYRRADVEDMLEIYREEVDAVIEQLVTHVAEWLDECDAARVLQ
jgi:hypothetical protein